MICVNAHVHKPIASDAIVAIENISITSLEEIAVANSTYSLGIHPWHIASLLQVYSIEDIAKWIDTVFDNHIQQMRCGVGEIGLDKCIDTSLALQTAIFVKQLQVAQKYQCPVIIHCVKAYNEIVALLLEQDITVSVVFHGFSGSEQLAQQLLRKGYFLSLGSQLQHKNPTKFAQLLKQIPAKQLVFETDEQPNSTIIDVYQWAIKITDITVVTDILNNRFCSFFLSK